MLRTAENKNSPRPPKIVVEAGGENYRVNLGALEDFIVQTTPLLGEHVYDFNYLCTALRRHVLLSTKVEHCGDELPDLLLILDEVAYLLNDLYMKEAN